MTNEELIHEMLDEIDAALMEYLDGDTTGPSKHSIIEKYFKQIREDTKRSIFDLMDEYVQWNSWDRNDGYIIHTDAIDDFRDWLKEIKKL